MKSPNFCLSHCCAYDGGNGCPMCQEAAGGSYNSNSHRVAELVAGVRAADYTCAVNTGSKADTAFLPTADLDAFPVDLSLACATPGCPEKAVHGSYLCVFHAKYKAAKRRAKTGQMISVGVRNSALAVMVFFFYTWNDDVPLLRIAYLFGLGGIWLAAESARKRFMGIGGA